MDPLPEEWQLLSFFETEPILGDADLPWPYNSLIYDLERDADSIHCELRPSYERLWLVWNREGTEILHLDLNWVSGITIETGGDRELLTATFRDTFLLPLELQLKPSVTVTWGTSAKLP